MYGISIALGIFLAGITAARMARKVGGNTDIVWGSVIWGVLFGVVGARIYHVLHFFPYYSQSPEKIFFIWQGGLGIYGALIGGALGIYLFLKRNILAQALYKWLDIFAAVTPLAQAVGRVGNYFNRELYGKLTDFPWGIVTGNESATGNERYHPLFAYESLLNFCLFLLLHRLWEKRALKDGVILAGYLIGYGLSRFFLEFLRIAPWKIHGINVAQIVSLGFVVVGMVLWRRANKLRTF